MADAFAPPAEGTGAANNRAALIILDAIKSLEKEFPFCNKDSVVDDALAAATGTTVTLAGGAAGAAGTSATVAALGLEAGAGAAGAVAGGLVAGGLLLGLGIASPIIFAFQRVKTMVHIVSKKDLTDGWVYHSSGKLANAYKFPESIPAGETKNFHVLNSGGSACGACGMVCWQVGGTKTYFYVLWDNAFWRSRNGLHVACGFGDRPLDRNDFDDVLESAHKESKARDWSCAKFDESKEYQWVSKTAMGLDAAGLMTSTRENSAMFAICDSH